MIKALYSFAIKVYGTLVWFMQPFNPKAKKWISGRKAAWDQIKKEERETIWVHASSLGEFEQGRPIIEGIKEEYPHYRILLTFFSPSGYEIRKNYTGADKTIYLPSDSQKNARRFIASSKPILAIFIKYDFWFNYLDELSAEKIPFIFISSVFDKQHFLLKTWARPLLDIFLQSKQVFVQDQRSYDLISSAGGKATVAGDTRIDRVIHLQSELKKYPLIEEMKAARKTIVFGSIWPEDLEIISAWIRNAQEGYFMIVAPHDVSPKMVERVQTEIKGNFSRLSLIEKGDKTLKDGIIIDTIGDLAHLYALGDIAYIGGGFGKSIHSILEPIAARLPVIFGPNHRKFVEADALIKLGAAQVVRTESDFFKTMATLQDPAQYQTAQEGIEQFLTDHRGATAKIVHYLASHKLIK